VSPEYQFRERQLRKLAAVHREYRRRWHDAPRPRQRKPTIIFNQKLYCYRSINGNQQLFSTKNFIATDPYGDFAIASPDGSRFSVKIGHDLPDTKADRLVYSFAVPSSSNSFSILFSYAIVIQNADHEAQDQPRFTVKVFNESKAEYIECSSFDFVAGYSQPDFLISQKDRNVSYKPWSSAAINLGAYKGDELRLEFTVNDCSKGGHFAYAYFDVMEQCSSSVTGNIICAGADDITLHAPDNFASYEWYTGNFSEALGTGNVYTAGKPDIGDSFAVVLVPYTYLGCRDTFYTTISSLSDTISLNVPDSVNGCSNLGVNLTDPKLTNGSSPFLKFEYFLDPDATSPVANPANIQTSGLYYIQALNSAGCAKTEDIVLNIVEPPSFHVMEPPTVRYPQTVNLRTLTDDQSLSYTYWEDQELIRQVQRPSEINESGFYYFKGTNAAGCFSVKALEVKVTPVVLVPNSFTPNGDVKNDRFVYNAGGKFKELSFFRVFNRFGQEVFRANSLGASWDGTFNGKLMENGTYVWMLKATDWLNKVHTAQGTILLIR
jgi:gliding motility-associated-like protein